MLAIHIIKYAQLLKPATFLLNILPQQHPLHFHQRSTSAKRTHKLYSLMLRTKNKSMSPPIQVSEIDASHSVNHLLPEDISPR